MPEVAVKRQAMLKKVLESVMVFGLRVSMERVYSKCESLSIRFERKI